MQIIRNTCGFICASSAKNWRKIPSARNISLRNLALAIVLLQMNEVLGPPSSAALFVNAIAEDRDGSFDWNSQFIFKPDLFFSKIGWRNFVTAFQIRGEQGDRAKSGIDCFH